MMIKDGGYEPAILFNKNRIIDQKNDEIDRATEIILGLAMDNVRLKKRLSTLEGGK